MKRKEENWPHVSDCGAQEASEGGYQVGSQFCPLASGDSTYEINNKQF